MPRWSKTSRSRVLSAGARALAMNSPSGSAAWPGPPASARTAVLLGTGWVGLGSRRSTLSEIVPAARPVRVSGTGTVVHENAALLAQGTNVSAPAEVTAKAADPHNASAATSRSVGVRLGIPADVSGRCSRDAPSARRPPAARRPPGERAYRPGPRRASCEGRGAACRARPRCPRCEGLSSAR